MRRADRNTTGNEAPMVITPSMVRRLLKQIARTVRPLVRRRKTE
jgi:hypothetical protein